MQLVLHMTLPARLLNIGFPYAGNWEKHPVSHIVFCIKHPQSDAGAVGLLTAAPHALNVTSKSIAAAVAAGCKRWLVRSFWFRRGSWFI